MTIKEQLNRYIRNGWDKSLMKVDLETDSSFALPRPFVPPCDEGAFRALIYWDAYFTGLGLIASDRIKEALDNVYNFQYAIKRFGYIPNGLAKAFLSRSQPPLFAWMVDDLFRVTKDLKWLEDVLVDVETEYDFWMTKRIAPNGLNRYGNFADQAERIGFYAYVKDRLGLKETDMDESELGSRFISEAESGWDFTPRFESRIEDFNPVDLNAILYRNEQILSSLFKELGNDEKKATYLERANTRKALMDRHMLSGQKIYVDHDYVNDTNSNLVTAASYLPYAVGMTDESHLEGLSYLNEKLDFPYGISTVEKKEREVVYQWDYPNTWPPLVCFAWQGHINHGLEKEAKRIADKYMSAVEKEFSASGHLYEKYDVHTGRKATHNEYPMTRMLGWTAGTYAHFAKFYKE